jgi:hypothetical protein
MRGRLTCPGATAYNGNGRAPVAQRIEQLPSKQWVAGSIPAGSALYPRRSPISGVDRATSPVSPASMLAHRRQKNCAT